jgi:hypothetical protein
MSTTVPGLPADHPTPSHRSTSDHFSRDAVPTP